MIHHAAQNALVRMLYDPSFAEAVRREPASTGLADEVLALVAAVDSRALRADPLRRRRTLGVLCEELSASTTLALSETGSVAFLEGFFGSPEFHLAVEERTPAVLALGAFLLAACDRGRLVTPALGDVIRLELLQARARREAAAIPHERASAQAGGTFTRVRLAPGCLYARLATDVLECVRAVERCRFELSLLPAAALCADGPRPRLPARLGPPATMALLTAPTESGLSLVALDDELDAVLSPLAGGEAMAKAALVACAAAAIGAARALALVDELVDDEVLVGLP